MGEYVTEKGLRITTKPIDPLIIKRVSDSVQTPRRPTYEAKTISGRVEVHPMDEEVARQVEGGALQWAFYQEELERSNNERFEKFLNVMFMLGTECDLPDDGWELLDSMLGLNVPEHPDQKRSHYLMTHLNQKDLARLQLQIMRETGVDEETLREVEESFPDSVRSESPEPGGSFVDSLATARPAPQVALATQPDLRGRGDGY
jgi:hypothetical protein